jgi:predicted lipid-binding transport protein (Tim44 family)
LKRPSIIRNRSLAAGLIALLLVAGLAPVAGEPDDLALAMNEQVLADRRIAAEYVRTGNNSLAAVTLQRLSKTLAGSAHADLAAAALKAAERGDATAASERLEELAEALAEDRHAGDQRVFADCIREAKKVYDPLDVYRIEKPDLKVSTTAVAISAAAASASAALERCEAEAGPAVANNPDFKRIVAGARRALEQVATAVDAEDADQLPGLLTDLRAYMDLLLFHYG